MAYACLYSDEDPSESSSDLGVSWVDRFRSIPGNDILASIPDPYIEDNFNLTDLPSVVPHFNLALQRILNYDITPNIRSEEHLNQIEEAAQVLYGLIHARYILSEHGLGRMRRFFVAHRFGTCPRETCSKSPVLPLGTSTHLGVAPVMAFCPCCREIYSPLPRPGKANMLDGAFFGPSFPHLFLLKYPALSPSNPPPRPITPRLFGFRVRKCTTDPVKTTQRSAPIPLQEEEK
eukprot:gnl/Dysnectes_brevis/3836_a4950_1034.p1 GENE.gnl/Dysnectes_brevis/3836_a4950_1034~~gnl/Dysnectes_brevis/3836_a4950_1034.p1  ORF type:complete len:233 (+),score=18.98 gnl/Dysnectes_brevis/3836_a4950_1034:42-740(+)